MTQQVHSTLPYLRMSISRIENSNNADVHVGVRAVNFLSRVIFRLASFTSRKTNNALKKKHCLKALTGTMERHSCLKVNCIWYEVLYFLYAMIISLYVVVTSEYTLLTLLYTVIASLYSKIKVLFEIMISLPYVVRS